MDSMFGAPMTTVEHDRNEDFTTNDSAIIIQKYARRWMAICLLKRMKREDEVRTIYYLYQTQQTMQEQMNNITEMIAAMQLQIASIERKINA